MSIDQLETTNDYDQVEVRLSAGCPMFGHCPCDSAGTGGHYCTGPFQRGICQHLPKLSGSKTGIPLGDSPIPTSIPYGQLSLDLQ
jgi:hypothetical protein